VGAVEGGIGIGNRVGCDQRQVACIGKIDKPRFGCIFDGIMPSGQLNVEPVGKKRPQAVEIGFSLVLLTIGNQPRKGTLRARSERD